MTAIQGLIDSPWQGVIYAAGGSLLISDLATSPGASNALIAAHVPYHDRAMSDLLGYEPRSYCSELTARRLAMRALIHARQMMQAPDERCLYGVGITAALRSDRPKRGEHRAYVALQTPHKTVVWYIPFEKGELSRLQEERKLADLALQLLRNGLELDDDIPDFEPVGIASVNDSVAQLLHETPASHGDPGHAVLPGAFNPLHDGHRRMLDIAKKRLNQRVAFELSVRNVDKPELDFIDINERTTQFDSDAYVLTNQPKFIEKARLLFSEAGGTFVVGSDTISRIDHVRYYESPQQRNDAIAELSELGIRFLVFGRREGDEFRTLDDLKLGSDLRDLCDGVAASEFRCDISSTELRAQRRNTS
ncbi:MAG: hypothetical protein OXG25_14590 [Gammaproteobacteria bacterium]|nr:hypothetical protein [Gammaproteobacteria bacterium]